MNILFLKGFNNYFNRTVKKYSALADYKSNSTSYLDYSSINFNPNDGVATELIVGSTSQQEPGSGTTTIPLKWEFNGTPDYAVCYEMEGTPASAVIKFRWFVMEAERTRNGQYRIALKRDVIADHLNEVLTAPCFVEKGNINNNGDPLLFNNEQMSMNQIKQSELLLKDNTGCGWIIGYVSQDKARYPASQYYESTSPVATIENYTDLPQVVQDLLTLGNFKTPVIRENTSWGIAAGRCRINAVNWKCASTPKYQGIGWSNVPWAGEASAGWQAPKYNNPLWSSNIVLNGVGFELSESNTVAVAAADFAQAVRYNATLRGRYISNILTNGYDMSQETYNTIMEYNGKFVEKDGKVYKIKFTEGNRIMGPQWDVAANTTYYTAFVTEWNSFKSTHSSEVFFRDGNNTILTSNVSIGSNGTVGLAWEIIENSLVLEESSADAGYTIKTYMPANRLQACDTPMDIFAIPFSDEFKVYTAVDEETGDLTDFFTMSKQVALQAAISLAQAGSNVYDIQILPYFPELSKEGNSDSDVYSGLIYNNMWVAPYSDFVEDKDFNYFYNDNDAKVGIMFWCRTSTFSVDINKQLTLSNTNPLTLKTSNDCDLYRLTSPNYAGSFEFNLAKSGGRVDKFNADCTYKPYSPYIHVTPYLSGLYGENFNAIDDARGLICGGDFSITKIVDQWQQYELQNKNYQQIFDRQIQNMDVNNQIAMEKANLQGIAGMLTGSLGGGMGGAMAGAKAGGAYGAIAGAVGGTVMGTALAEIGYVKDMEWLRRSQEENKNYAIDMYGYQLGNIKALPNALAKTSALTNNNKIFPFVEYFTCTDAEKSAFRDKVKYNGMTIMKISTLGTYSTSSDFDRVYVKGQLIRLDNIADDFHVLDAIYQEVFKGFFIPQVITQISNANSNGGEVIPPYTPPGIPDIPIPSEDM